jgi:hypothetical protein
MWGSLLASALITRPRVRSDLLMLPASFAIAPSAPDRATLSDPARSTRVSAECYSGHKANRSKLENIPKQAKNTCRFRYKDSVGAACWRTRRMGVRGTHHNACGARVRCKQRQDSMSSAAYTHARTHTLHRCHAREALGPNGLMLAAVEFK